MSRRGPGDLAAVAGVLADPRRARIVLALADGRALPASVLATEAGVAASTTSSHLGRLVELGLLQVFRQGRFRYYALAGPQVADLVEAPAGWRRPNRSGRSGRAAALRRYVPPAPVTTTSWLRRADRGRAVFLTPNGRRVLAERLGVSLSS